MGSDFDVRSPSVKLKTESRAGRRWRKQLKHTPQDEFVIISDLHIWLCSAGILNCNCDGPGLLESL